MISNLENAMAKQTEQATVQATEWRVLIMV